MRRQIWMEISVTNEGQSNHSKSLKLFWQIVYLYSLFPIKVLLIVFTEDGKVKINTEPNTRKKHAINFWVLIGNSEDGRKSVCRFGDAKK